MYLSIRDGIATDKTEMAIIFGNILKCTAASQPGKRIFKQLKGVRVNLHNEFSECIVKCGGRAQQ